MCGCIRYCMLEIADGQQEIEIDFPLFSTPKEMHGFRVVFLKSNKQ